MHTAVAGPVAKGLSEVEKDDAARAPECDQAHIGHDGREVAALEDPRGDENGEAVAPHVLVDGDADEDAAGDGFVTVNSVCGRDGWESGNLDAGARIPDNNDGLREVY